MKRSCLHTPYTYKEMSLQYISNKMSFQDQDEKHYDSSQLYYCMLLIAGYEEKIKINRTEIDVYDNLFNQIHCAPRYMHRETAGSRKEGLHTQSSDIDLFFYLTDHHVVWDLTHSECYDPATDTLIFMESQEHLPGTAYMRLVSMHRSNNTISKISCIQRNEHTYISSELFLKNAESYCRDVKVFQHGPCQTSTFDDTEYDYVCALACRKWPPQTNNWISRCRKFGWPDNLTIKNMISSGCFLVPIGSKQSRHNNDPNLEMEWRLSFVLAEQILVRAMNHCQFMCYALLKVFLQEVLNKDAIKEDQKISSYFLKTVMFWCIQTDANYNWSSENFFECFWKCYKVLLQWIYTGYCPNFFVPKNNLFVCKIEGADQERLFTQMYDLYCHKDICLTEIPSLKRVMMDVVLANPLVLKEKFNEHMNDVEIHNGIHLINGFQRQDIDFDWEALFKVIRMDVSKMSNIEKILISRHACNIFIQLAFLEHKFCRHKTKCNKNKQVYEKHMKVGVRLLKFTIKYGCATDHLYLALYRYINGDFNNSLNILYETRKRLFQDYVFYCYNNHFQNPEAYEREMQSKTMPVKIKNAMASDIFIRYHTIFLELNIEIDLLKKSTPRKSLLISPFVFLEFLIFLCHYRLKSPHAYQSLQRLHLFVLTDSGRYINRYTRDIAWDIVGISHHLLGNLEKARDAYNTSLQQFLNNGIDEAVKERLAHIETMY